MKKNNINPMISIIIPVYNVEKYLHKCLGCIINQTYKTFELILVDDGSSDKSGEICDDYALRDSRIRVFHIKNGGAASARNFGLENAVGEWIAFVDSDDYISDDYLEVLASGTENYDLILSGFTRVFSSGFKSVNKYENIDCVNKEKIGENLYNIECAELLNSQCCKLFKKTLIDRYEIRFSNGLSVSEDMLFCFEYFTHVESVLCLNYYGYFYRLSSEGSLSKRIHPYNDYYNAMNQLYEYRKEFIRQFDVNDSRYTTFIEQNVFSCFLWSLRALFKLKKQERIDVYQNLFESSILLNSIKFVEMRNFRNEILMYSIRSKSILIFELYRYIFKIINMRKLIFKLGFKESLSV